MGKKNRFEKIQRYFFRSKIFKNNPVNENFNGTLKNQKVLSMGLSSANFLQKMKKLVYLFF